MFIQFLHDRFSVLTIPVSKILYRAPEAFTTHQAGDAFLYEYAGNNPLKYVDNLGLYQASPWDNVVHDPSTNCSFVADCVDAYREQNKWPVLDPKVLITREYMWQIKCGFMNACVCKGSDKCENPDGWIPISSQVKPDPSRKCEDN